MHNVVRQKSEVLEYGAKTLISNVIICEVFLRIGRVPINLVNTAIFRNNVVASDTWDIHYGQHHWLWMLRRGPGLN
jgi:hypothetical protein